MSSFKVYDPKTHAFRVLDTSDTIDLPFEQVLLLNILIESRVQTELLVQMAAEQETGSKPPAVIDDPDELRQEMVQEI